MGNRKTGEFLNKKCTQLVNNAMNDAENSKNEAQYDALKENLKGILTEIGMKVEIHFFGSRIIGLANNESDLDIFIEYENNFYNDKDVERDRNVLERIWSAIVKSKLWKVEKKILNASVPILCLIYTPDKIKCDISCSNGLGVKNSLIMRYIFDLQPESKRLYHFIKIFMNRYRKFFDGYLLKLLVIFFLQNLNLLPSVQSIQEDLPAVTINGWNVQFDTSRMLSYYKLKQMENSKTYIQNFFEFYSRYNYSNDVMSIHDGKSIARLRYEYQDEIEGQLLCIFGPINKRHNIGKYPSEKDVKYFMSLSKSLSLELENNLNYTLP